MSQNPSFKDNPSSTDNVGLQSLGQNPNNTDPSREPTERSPLKARHGGDSERGGDVGNGEGRDLLSLCLVLTFLSGLSRF